jgi:hypothetical protein
MLLLRLPYPYGKKQTWMPTDLMKVAGQLERVGVSATVMDLNLEQLPDRLAQYGRVGIGVIGAPYIPSSRGVAGLVYDITGKKAIIGGQGVKYLDSGQFKAIYGDSAVQVCNDAQLASVLSLSQALPSVYQVSISRQINAMKPEKLKAYLTSEFSFFVSQGCKYGCDFCAAERSREGHGVTERFSLTIGEDLKSILTKATELGVKELKMYMSALDAFQNPPELKRVLTLFARAREEFGVSFKLRALSRIDSFLNAVANEEGLTALISSSGLKTIGFGVDGATPEEWTSQHKANKSLREADEAFDLCWSLGATADALMVMGFHDRNGIRVGNKETLQADVDFSIDRAERNGVVARPHLAKDMVPGSAGWRSPVWAASRDKLLGNPNLFVNLDFVALASEITHPNAEFRQDVNIAYLKIINTLTPKNLCATSPLRPRTGNEHEDSEADEFNRLAPFHR